MGKNGLDERQEQITAKAGALGFYVMFLTAVFVILVQLLWNGSIENVIGDTDIDRGRRDLSGRLCQKWDLDE